VVRPERIPAVSLTVSAELPSVLPDNAAVGKLAAEHLLELGYHNFAFYFWESKLHELQRSEALRQQLNLRIHRFYKINFTPRPRVRHQPMETRMRILRRALRRLPRPLAIMAPLDDLGVEVMEACESLGLRVPADVGVLGVNNDALICDFTPVPLSSIDDNEYQIGYEGAALLDRIMQGKAPPRRPLLVQPRGVAVRKSTDLLDISRVPDRYVVRAVRFIAQHYQSSIRTDDVVAEAGICKRALQQRFAEHMGHTIHAHIVIKRIQHAKRLLRETDLKTKAIAAESGFGSRERFSRTFKQAVGMSPDAFRKAT